MTSRELFAAYKTKWLKVKRLQNQLEELQDISIHYSIEAGPHGSLPKASTETIALKIAKTKENLIIEFYDTEKMAFSIMKMLDQMEDQTEASLLFYRYIMLYPWKDVNEKLTPFRGDRQFDTKALMGYLNRKALKSFQTVLDQNAKAS